MATQSLYDLITLQNADPVTGLVEDVTTLAPEFNDFEAVPRPGINYPVARRTAFPTVQFRRLNAGVQPSKSQFKRELKEMCLLDALINMDIAVDKADEQSTGSLFMHENQGVMRQAFITLGSQVWYGTSADINGFLGVRSQISGNIGAGGTSSSTSAYLMFMDREWGCRFDVGNGGSMSVSEPIKQQVVDPNDSTKALLAWVANLNCFIGFNIISQYSAWGVTGITTHQTSSQYDQRLTDQIAAKLIANIPMVRRFNLRWFMNRTAYWLLQDSRSTVNVASGTYYSAQPMDAGGRPGWSERPNSCEGYPITVTDSITNTETN